MGLEFGECSERSTRAGPGKIDKPQSLLIIAATRPPPGRIEALSSEFPQLVVIEVDTASAACRQFALPVALILVDSVVLETGESELVLLRAIHPHAHIAAMYPTVTAARQPAASRKWSKLCSSLLPMDLELDIWLAVIRLMLSGGEYLPLHAVEYALVAKTLRSDQVDDSPRMPLTTRELQILEKASQGMQNKLIAAEFRLSEHTVKVHLHNIISKLGVHNRTEAAAKYRALVDLIHKR